VKVSAVFDSVNFKPTPATLSARVFIKDERYAWVAEFGMYVGKFDSVIPPNFAPVIVSL
jgi:hypothetical protein